MSIRNAVLFLAVALGAVPAMAADKPALKVAAGKNFAGASSVVVGSFSVAFITEKTDAAFAGSRIQGGVGKIAKSHLDGIGPADFQAITDALYADFVQRMAAAGFTFVDREAMLAHKEIQKASFKPAGTEATVHFGKDSEGSALFYAPTAFGASALFANEVGIGQSGSMFALGGLKALGNMGSMMAKPMYAAIAKQPMVNINYVVDYADAQRYGGRLAVVAAVNNKAQLAVVDTISTVTAYGPKGGAATLTLQEAVATGGDYGRLENTTTGGQKLENAAGKAIGLLTGGSTTSYARLTFFATPQQYREGAIDAGTRTNALVVDQLAALR